MRTKKPLLVVVAPLAFAACALPVDGETEGGRSPRPGGSAPSSPSASLPPRAPDRRPGPGLGPPTATLDEPAALPPIAAGWSDMGEVVLFDALDGEVLSAAPGADLGGERDLVVDPWLSRLIVFEADSEDPWGEVALYPLVPSVGDGASGAGGADGADGVALGPREHEVWVDGTARLAASPSGAVLFEESYGARWRLVRADGVPSASVAAPRPASIATDLLPDGRLRVTALTYGFSGDDADMRVAVVGPEGIDTPVAVPLSTPPVSMPLGARWVQSADGGHLVDVASGDVVLSTVAGGGWPALAPVGVGPGIVGVEQAAVFPGGERLALLTSGAVDLVVVGLGSGGAPECAAGLDLPGEVEAAGLFFARGLAIVGADRLLVATTGGVAAVTVSDDCPPLLEVDAGFDGSALRGPLGMWP